MTIFNLPPVIYIIVIIGLMLSCFLLGYYIAMCIAYTEIEEDCEDYEQEIEYLRFKLHELKPFISTHACPYEPDDDLVVFSFDTQTLYPGGEENDTTEKNCRNHI